MKGKIISLSKDTSGQWILTLNISSEITAVFDELKDIELRIELKKWRERRSLDANAYFHLLVDKLAKAIGLSVGECKIKMVLDYGTIMMDSKGAKLGVKIPATADASKVFEYARKFDTRTENGIEFDCFIIYEHTRNYDTKEMAQLIDGVVQECKQVGIETMTPYEIERMLDRWK